jgi:hypothetical protein
MPLRKRHWVPVPQRRSGTRRDVTSFSKRLSGRDKVRRFSMRKSIALIVLAALLAAPTAFAQSPGQDQSKSAQGYKPSADTPAKQKERNGDYSKTPGMPATNQGRLRSRTAKSGQMSGNALGPSKLAASSLPISTSGLSTACLMWTTWTTHSSRVDTRRQWCLHLRQRLNGESQYGVLAEPRRPSLRILPPETDKQHSTPRESLLAVMNANRGQFNQRL